MATLSVQESLYPEITCFGCGHANPTVSSYGVFEKTTSPWLRSHRVRNMKQVVRKLMR